MKSFLKFRSALILLVGISVTGCYTQMRTVQTERVPADRGSDYYSWDSGERARSGQQASQERSGEIVNEEDYLLGYDDGWDDSEAYYFKDYEAQKWYMDYGVTLAHNPSARRAVVNNFYFGNHYDWYDPFYSYGYYPYHDPYYHYGRYPGWHSGFSFHFGFGWHHPYRYGRYSYYAHPYYNPYHYGPYWGWGYSRPYYGYIVVKDRDDDRRRNYGPRGNGLSTRGGQAVTRTRSGNDIRSRSAASLREGRRGDIRSSARTSRVNSRGSVTRTRSGSSAVRSRSGSSSGRSTVRSSGRSSSGRSSGNIRSRSSSSSRSNGSVNRTRSSSGRSNGSASRSRSGSNRQQAAVQTNDNSRRDTARLNESRTTRNGGITFTRGTTLNRRPASTSRISEYTRSTLNRSAVNVNRKNTVLGRAKSRSYSSSPLNNMKQRINNSLRSSRNSSPVINRTKSSGSRSSSVQRSSSSSNSRSSSSTRSRSRSSGSRN